MRSVKVVGIASIALGISLVLFSSPTGLVDYSARTCSTSLVPPHLEISSGITQSALPGQQVYAWTQVIIHPWQNLDVGELRYTASYAINDNVVNLGAPFIDKWSGEAYWIFQVPYNTKPGEYGVTMNAFAGCPLGGSALFFNVQNNPPQSA